MCIRDSISCFNVTDGLLVANFMFTKILMQVNVAQLMPAVKELYRLLHT